MNATIERPKMRSEIEDEIKNQKLEIFNSQIAGLLAQEEPISIKQLCDEMCLLMVHALPDDLDYNDSLGGFTKRMPWEMALDTVLNQPIQNLCCSSVLPGDRYNRWGGTIYGVVINNGKIQHAKKSDANSWNQPLDDSKDRSPTNSEIAEAIRKPDERAINEFQIKTNPEDIIPYLDLDIILEYCWKGHLCSVDRSFTEKGQTVITKKNTLSKIREFPEQMKKRGFKPVCLYRGKLVELDLNELADMIGNNFDQDQLTGTDYQKYHRVKANYGLLQEYINRSIKSIELDEVKIKL